MFDSLTHDKNGWRFWINTITHSHHYILIITHIMDGNLWSIFWHEIIWVNGQGGLEISSKQIPRLVVLCKTTFLCKFVCNKLIDWCKRGKNFGNIVTLSTSSILTWSHPMSFYWTSFCHGCGQSLGCHWNCWKKTRPTLDGCLWELYLWSWETFVETNFGPLVDRSFGNKVETILRIFWVVLLRNLFSSPHLLRIMETTLGCL